MIFDNMGILHRVPFRYSAERLSSNMQSIDFGNVDVGASSRRTITITNNGTRPVTVQNIRSTVHNAIFTLRQPTTFPVTIQPGTPLTVEVQAQPPQPHLTLFDTLQIMHTCSTVRLPMQVSSLRACVAPTDLAFGGVPLNEPKTLTMRICNDGSLASTFQNASGDVIEWDGAQFSISESVLTQLAATSLAPDECVDVPVTFRATAAGTYRAVARVHTTGNTCRDTSVWTANSSADIVSVESEGMTGSWLGDNTPNPFIETTDILFSLARPAHTKIEVYDERGVLVRTLVDGDRPAGEQRVHFDASSLPSGVYICRISAGGWTTTRAMIRQ
jgi:hypothetical protein